MRVLTPLSCAFLSLLLLSPSRAAPPAAESEAQGLVQRWLKAQNDGDFAAYEALYAERFTGKRQSGERSFNFDRAGWLRDRQRMFKKPMKVAIADLRIAAAQQSAQVRFTQTWESGTYRDVGSKQLVLARDAAGLHIAREEMLSSTVLAQPAAQAPGAEDYLRVVAQRVVLSYEPEDGWAKGTPKLLAEDDPVVVAKDAAEEKLPPEVLRWRGQKLRLFDLRGARCEATVRGFQILGRVVPHFGTRQAWKEDPKQAPQEAWELANGGRLLAAELTGLTPACKEAYWARLASAKIPTVAPAESPNAELRQVALAAFRKLPGYRKVQKEYDDWYASEKPDTKKAARWENHERDQTTVWVMRWQQGERKAAVLAVQSRATGCGGFGGSMWAVWDLPEGGAPVLRKAETEASLDGLTPLAAVDLDDDGRPEILFQNFMGEGVLRGTKTEVRSIPYLDCPC